MKFKPLNYASRDECDIELEIIEGELPDDLNGSIFVIGPCGSVNHEWPAPRYWKDGSTCQEHGAPLINGDGMLYRFDFTSTGQAFMKNRLLKTPDYFADEATKEGTKYFEDGFCFDSAGLSRSHVDLGTRNQANTALNQVKFSDDQPMMLTANFDAGRPFLVDPQSLKIISPIGKQQEWLQALPDELEQLFPLIYSTAHPCFDPRTREFFTVCHQKSLGNLMFNTRVDRKVMMATKFLDEELKKFTDWLTGEERSLHDIGNALRDFIPWLNEKHKKGHKHEFSEHFQIKDPGLDESELRVMKWTGEKLDSWLVVDRENQVPVSVTQTMHQTSLTEDYIILCDCTLKMAMDILQSLPFGDFDKINALVRRITTDKIKPVTPFYVIKRSDLKPEAKRVEALKLKFPWETIHFNANYKNPDGIITIHGSHNSAVCGAEWIRPYDKRATDGKEIPEDRLGMMCTHGLDVGRIGKHTVDVKNGTIKSESLSETGFSGEFPDKFENVHTWGLGLYAHRNMISDQLIEDKIKYVFHQFYGLDENEFTQFTYDLYKDYNPEGRQIGHKEMLEYYRHGAPQCLTRQNTETMQFEDFYIFNGDEQMRSFEFVPAVGTEDHPESQIQGYLGCMMMVKDPEDDSTTPGYARQMFVFKADDLKSGPICKIAHDKLGWGFTIHSCFSNEVKPANTNYRVSTREDCEYVTSRFPRDSKKVELMDFLEKEVLPHSP